MHAPQRGSELAVGLDTDKPLEALIARVHKDFRTDRHVLPRG